MRQEIPFAHIIIIVFFLSTISVWSLTDELMSLTTSLPLFGGLKSCWVCRKSCWRQRSPLLNLNFRNENSDVSLVFFFPKTFGCDLRVISCPRPMISRVDGWSFTVSTARCSSLFLRKRKLCVLVILNLLACQIVLLRSLLKFSLIDRTQLCPSTLSCERPLHFGWYNLCTRSDL